MTARIILFLSLLYVPLAFFGCSSTSSNRGSVTAFRTPYVEPPSGPRFDPMTVSDRTIDIPWYRPTVERGMQANAVQRLLGAPDNIGHQRRVWIYSNYRSDSETAPANETESLVLVFDHDNRVQEMKLVNSGALQAYLQTARLRL